MIRKSTHLAVLIGALSFTQMAATPAYAVPSSCMRDARAYAGVQYAPGTPEYDELYTSYYVACIERVCGQGENGNEGCVTDES